MLAINPANYVVPLYEISIRMIDHIIDIRTSSINCFGFVQLKSLNYYIGMWEALSPDVIGEGICGSSNEDRGNEGKVPNS